MNRISALIAGRFGAITVLLCFAAGIALALGPAGPAAGGALSALGVGVHAIVFGAVATTRVFPLRTLVVALACVSVAASLALVAGAAGAPIPAQIRDPTLAVLIYSGVTLLVVVGLLTIAGRAVALRIER